jgi:hypothetical protein
MLRRKIAWGLMLVALFAGACSPTLAADERKSKTQTAEYLATLLAHDKTNQQQAEISTPEPTMVPSITPPSVENASVWADESVPAPLKTSIHLMDGAAWAPSKDQANLHFGVVHTEEESSAWIYALVVPFPTLLDQVTEASLRQEWRGEPADPFTDKGILVSATTKAAFEGTWGPAGSSVRVLPDDQILDTAWKERGGSDAPVFAIVPFENLEPRWKVLRIDGMSPFDRSVKGYSLVVHFGWQESSAGSIGNFPTTNRDPEKMTTLVMTGVTALVRLTAARMEKFGMTYPGEEIQQWLQDADLTHISNEVSFTPKCPPANPKQTSLVFCSRPEYIELLDSVGADIIELSGNHLMDWRVDAMPYSLDLYKQHNMKVYAGGNNLEDARKVLIVENHGNRLAFIGCNPAGPESDWATADRPGTATCDYDWMKSEIARLKADGEIPIVTLQFFESYSLKPATHQKETFFALSDAGADIVSGSQAHFPQGFAFNGSRFIHYGLGNLFFDQMRLPDYSGVEPLFDKKNLPVAGTRLEFMDRHVIYDGRYIGTEELTAMLEDYSRPRPLTAEERNVFLKDTFAASGW